MKKFHYLLTAMFIAVFMISCEKEMMDKQLETISKSGSNKVYCSTSATNVASTPVSNSGIIPYIIPGLNKGGNRTCDEVALAFNTTFDLCGQKLDYGDFDRDGDNEFNGSFPNGLNVTVQGNFISYQINGCLSIDGENYKVGAVIVKGANAANVYFYPNGSSSDAGLAAPKGTHMVSNLTFCLVKCEEVIPQWVIALKTILSSEAYPYAYAVSGGNDLPNSSLFIGYNDYVFGGENTYPLIFGFGSGNDQIGTINAKDYIENGIHYLEISIDTDSDEWLFKETYLYVGTLDGFKSYLDLFPADGTYILSYGDFPFFNDEESNSRIFKIPFDEITE